MIYLNNAATTWPKPEIVYQRMDSFFRSLGRNPGRSGATENKKAGLAVYEVRESLADFFNIKDAAHLVFNSGATESLNTILKGLLKPGDHVLTTMLEHNSVLRPLEKLKKERDIEITFLAINQQTGEPHYDQIKNEIKENTRLLVSSHASNVTGTIVDIEKMGNIAEKNNLYFLVDAAQTAGVFPIDVEKMKIDFLAVAGHKSLYGPPGVGALYLRNDSEVASLKEGGTGTNSLNTCQPDLMPDRFEAGTANTVGIIGMGTGLSFILDEGLAKIREHELKLTEKLLTGLKMLPSVRIYGQENIGNRAPVVSFNVANISSHELGFSLEDDYQITVRSGLHCAPYLHQAMQTNEQGMVRVSFGYFNTEKEVAYLLEVLDKFIRQKGSTNA